MKLDSHDQKMFAQSLKDLKQTLETQEKEVLPPIQDDRLFKACLYIGNMLGIKMTHPESTGQVEPERISAWMEVLAERSGISYRIFELKGQWFKSIVDPFVAFTGEKWIPNVVIPKGDSGAILLDIETGQRQLIDQELAKKIQRVGFMFYESMPEDRTGVLELIKIGFKSLKGHLTGIFSVILLFSCVKLFTPYSNQLIFDHVIPAGNYSLFVQLVFALVLVNGSSLILTFVRSFTTLRYRTIMENKMQAALWDRFFNLPVTIFHKYPRGDLTQRLSLINNIRPFLMGEAFYTIVEAPFAVVYLMMMLSYSAPLGILMLVMMVAFYAASFAIRLYILPLLAKQLQRSADLNSFLIQMVSGIAKIRMAAASQRAFAKWAKLFADYQRLSFKIGVRQIYFSLLSSIYPIISLAATYAAAVYYLKDADAAGESTMTMGQFVAFQSAFGLLSGSVGGILSLMGGYMETMQTVRRTNELLKEPPEQSGKRDYVSKLKGEIIVEHVSFKYPGTQTPVLTDISFHCKPGQFFGLVGRSGCGKSTILRLLTGLEKLETGKIYYDGILMENIDYSSLRRRMGVVLQTATVSSGTVRDNITMGRHVSKERLEKVLEAAQFDAVLKTMPMGLDTLLTAGGGTISGGEQQRLLLARALLTDVDILLLDEATSALDSLTQEVVMKNLEELKVTRIVVAHRLETVRKADEILVVKNGTIVEKGTFDALCESSTVFNAMRTPSKKEREEERKSKNPGF